MTKSIQTFRAAFCGFLIAILAGCASAKKTAFITDFDKMPKGQHVDRFRSNPQLLNSNTLSNIFLADIDTTSVKDAKGISAHEAAASLREAFVTALKEKGMSSVADRSSATSELQLAISELNPGDQAARIFAAELGAGHAKVQVDGKLTAKTGEEIAAFVDRRNRSGAIGFRDVGGDAGPKMIEEMFNQIASKAVQELTAKR